MGNNPSTNKAPTPTSSSSAASASAGPARSHSHSLSHDSPRASKKDPRNLIPNIHHHSRAPAEPEASVVQAQGSTISNRNSQSRPLSILHPSPPTQSHQSSASPPRTSDSRPRPIDRRYDEPAKPLDVPAAHSDPAAAAAAHEPQYSSYHEGSQYEASILTSGPASGSITDLSYQMARPPRLPLPIEEEVHTPGSPIAVPTDPGTVVDHVSTLDDPSNLHRRASGLSNATDEDDSEELRVDKSRPTVPTRVEWLRGGQKVYVTGTPFQWSRKQRLHPSKDREGVLETIINVFPGTHHIKFLVDGNMQTSHDLPTTVDFGNNLVNYIEASGEDATARHLNLDTSAPKSSQEAQALPSRQASTLAMHEGAPKAPATKSIAPVEQFSEDLPRYLSDFDQAEDSSSYKISAKSLEKLSSPPGLPSFLSKPILNNTTLIKDDNSVLNMPNHTVLNHLGTSSIKNNVLAVSATTRYMSKYVTTIIYKPTTD